MLTSRLRTVLSKVCSHLRDHPGIPVPQNARKGLIEAAGDIVEPDASSDSTRQIVRAALEAKIGSQVFFSVEEWVEDRLVYHNFDTGELFQVSFTIGDDKAVEFGEPLAVERVFRALEADAPATQQEFSELATLVPLSEAAAVSEDGEIQIKVISPGQGSSGYYPEDVLQADGPKVATTGLHMYWDHPTATEASERPERSLKDLAGVFTGNAYYDKQGSSGPGLYAKAKVFEEFRGPINEIAEHIGLSIRGSGQLAEREVGGEKREVISKIDSLESVDFVTRPGRGGEIVTSIFESAGRRAAPIKKETPQPEATAVDNTKLEEAQARIAALEKEVSEAKATGDGNELIAVRLARIEARSLAESELAGRQLPAEVKARILDSVSASPALSESGDVDPTKLTEAVKAEVDSVLEVARSFGARVEITENGGDPPTPESIDDLKAKLAESSARRLGVKPETAKEVWGVA